VKGRRSGPVELWASVGGCIELGVSLRHGPGATGAVDGDGGPAATVLVADVDKQGVVVVFDPDPVVRVALLMQTADRPPW